MNSPVFTRVKPYTNFILSVLFLSSVAHAEWEIDFSRRRSTPKPAAPPSIEVQQRQDESRAQINQMVGDTLKPLTPVAMASEPSQPDQEIVILNTDKGFLPATIRVRQGGRYLVHVVNINEKEKNVSFMLDAFSENHATFFGQVKTFQITPQKDGIYSFQCPETSMQGKLVVFPAMDLKQRLPAAALAPEISAAPAAPVPATPPVVHLTPDN